MHEASIIPLQEVFGANNGKLLVLSWGGTYGVIRTAVAQSIAAGHSVAHAHLRFLNPFPRNLGEILAQYDQVLVPELNNGQLAFLIQGQFARKVLSYRNLNARPLKIADVRVEIDKALGL